MGERHTSPYTGRPVDESLTQGIELSDAGGDQIGKVVEINPDFIVAERDGGFLGLGVRRTYYIPRDQIARQDEDDWYLSIDKDQVDLMGWTEPPSQSEWSREYVRGGEAEAAQGRGTRIRRHKEDLETATVQRHAGRVVEIRREEIDVDDTTQRRN